MKLNPQLQKWFASAVFGLILAGSTSLVTAQAIPTDWITSFDTDISANGNSGGPGGNCGSLTTAVWDGTVDCPGGPNSPSGSEYITIAWPNSAPWTWEEVQLSFGEAWPGIDATAWLKVEFDVKVDVAHSYLDRDGNYGRVQPIAQSWSSTPPNMGWVGLGTTLLQNTNGWQHCVGSFASFPTTLNNLVIDFNGQETTNAIAYWLDNIKLTAAPIPPPTLGQLQPATVPGLTLFPDTGGQYQRVMVYPNETVLGTDFGWYGKPGPVSYSFTITKFPTQNDYAANLFLIPNATMMYTPNDTSVDWNCTNSVIFNITANTNNPATNWNVSFSVKTNLQANNPNLTLVTFNYPTIPNGTWRVTFNNNTDFTITPPNPSYTTNSSLPPDVMELVTGHAIGDTALTPYFGIMNRALSNIGVPCVFGGVAIQGASTNLNDAFDAGVFDTNIWTKLTDYAPDIMVLTSDVKGYLSWNVPNDQNYTSLIVAPSPTGPWSDLSTSANWLLVNGSAGSTHQAVLSKSALHAVLGGAETNAAYFRMVKRVATQLQILLPGETNAPGTATGKIGTPTPQTAGNPFDLTINACDATWHIASSSDSVAITSSDGSAFTPPNATLVYGSVTITGNFFFGSSGTWTVTATDATPGSTLLPNTSTPITIP